MKQKANHQLLGLLITAVFILGLYLFKPITFKEASTIEGFIEYTRSFGPVMPIAVFLITVIQAIIPVIPFVILCSANAIIFGIPTGFLLTWVGTLTGASLTFFVSRKLGYEWVARKYRGSNLKNIERMNGAQGFLLILSLRLLPYFPAPLINVSAGVSRISFLWFLLASAIGKLPFIFVYIYLGYNLLHSKNYTLGAVVMIALLLVPYLIVRKTKKRAIPEAKEP